MLMNLEVSFSFLEGLAVTNTAVLLPTTHPSPQIPLKLSILCKEAQLQHPKSAAVYVSTTVMHTILNRAACEGVLQPGTQLCATTLRQVQQSGLLQQLAGMMTDAAEEMAQLTAAAAAAAAAAADEGHDPLEAVLGGQVPAADSSSSSRPNHSKVLSSTYHVALQTHRDQLLFVLGNLARMHLLGSHQLLIAVPADAFIAALHLANGSLQYVSAVLTCIQQKQPGHQQLTVLVNEAMAFVASSNQLLLVLASILLSPAGLEGLIKEVPQVQPLLLSPDLLPALAAMVATLALAMVADQVSSSGDGGGERSGAHGSSSSSSSGGSAWQPPKQLQLELSPAQLQLCDVLGVSGQTLLWAAGLGFASKADYIQLMHVCSSAYFRIVSFYSDRTEELPPQLLLQMARLDLLLPSFVLRWLDSIPTSDPQWVMQCSLGCNISINGFTGVRLRLEYQEPSGVPMQQGQQQEATPAQVLQQLLLQQPPSVELIAEVLPVVLRLCMAIRQLQQTCPSTGGASQAVSGDTTSSSKQAGEASSRRAGAGLGGSSGQPATQPMSPAQERTYNCRKASMFWINMVKGLLDACILGRGVLAGSGNALAYAVEAFPSHLQLFTQHAVDLLTVFEGTMREEAGTSRTKIIAPLSVGALCMGELQHRPAALLTVAREAGPGSQAQLHMYSLLCTMLKISGSGAVGMKETVCDFSRRAAAEAAVMLLVTPTREAMQAFQVGGASAVGEGSLRNTGQGEGSAAAAAAILQEYQGRVAAAAAAATKALVVLPCLVILRRCLIQWAQQLQAEVPFLVQQSAEGLQGYIGQADAEFRASTMCFYMQWTSQTVCFVMLVQYWLQTGSHSAELAAAGYAPQPLFHQLDQLLAALEAFQTRSSGGNSETPDAAAYAAVVEQLQSTGLALCALAVPCICNYPGCTNLSGLTELGTVSGRSCMCGGCRVAHYCSRACQKRHWKQHKPVCAALAGAAVSSGSPV